MVLSHDVYALWIMHWRSHDVEPRMSHIAQQYELSKRMEPVQSLIMHFLN